MLKTTVDIDFAVDRILTTRKYGDILSYEFLESLLDAKREDLEFVVKMAKLKDTLIECGYVLSCLINEGYRILEPNEIADEVMKKYVKSSINKLEKSIRIMKYADRKELNKEELKVFEAFESTLLRMHRENENNMLDMQAMLSAVKQKELEN